MLRKNKVNKNVDSGWLVDEEKSVPDHRVLRSQGKSKGRTIKHRNEADQRPLFWSPHSLSHTYAEQSSHGCPKQHQLHPGCGRQTEEGKTLWRSLQLGESRRRLCARADALQSRGLHGERRRMQQRLTTSSSSVINPRYLKQKGQCVKHSVSVWGVTHWGKLKHTGIPGNGSSNLRNE